MSEQQPTTMRTRDCVFHYDPESGTLTITYEDEENTTVLLFPGEIATMLDLLAGHRETIYRKAQEAREA